MFAIHEAFRFDDPYQANFLAQCRIASQGLRVGLNATPTGNVIVDSNYRAPLGKASAHGTVFDQTIAQSVQTFGYLLAGMSGQIRSTEVNFDPDNDSRATDGLREGNTIVRLLANRLIADDSAANTFP